LNAVLNVNDYTSKVDDPRFEGEEQSNSNFRFQEQLKNITAVLTGIVLSVDYKEGQKLLNGETTFKDYIEIYEELFEIGRRYKIMNPEKMRTEYGKLIYLLQDLCNPKIAEALEIQSLKKVYTVHDILSNAEALNVLDDDLIRIATMEIIDDGVKARYQIQEEIKMKERAVEVLAEKYKNDKIDDEGIKLCLRSIGDNNSFLRSNCEPIEKLIEYLKEYFNPLNPEEQYSLKIEEGHEGARLSHTHQDQYEFVLQSLTLWKNITNDMFKLWCLAEDDILDPENKYYLSNTGQGVHRLQPAPRVYPAMEDLLSGTKTMLQNNWVGSSKIHLGDHNVPNTLMFIDKYTQVPRIINPILNCMKNLPKVVEKDRGLDDYVNKKYGSLQGACKYILCDFFRAAFDGSGANNFYDAGSCIDGRLTSAWNWCSKLEEKEYYHLFKLTGFLGFDGDFQK